MLNRFLLLFCLILPLSSFTQTSGYWQQAVDYQMEVELNDQTHRLDGHTTLTYSNHSPDTLRKVFFYLFWNAFQTGSMMEERLESLGDPSEKLIKGFSRLTDTSKQGFQRIRDFAQDGSPLDIHVEGSIMWVKLANPILPGEKTTFTFDFETQVPIEIRRGGRNSADGVDYTFTQWYPKICEYDYEGWHAHPYIGREFHGVWGDYDVKMTLDAKYVIGGSGYLQNPDEIGHGYSEQAVSHPEGKKLTWHFVAPQVHDFAWVADPGLIHDQKAGPNGTQLHFFYLKDDPRMQSWVDFQPLMVQGMKLMNARFGTYPYKQYSFIEGGDNGMEYAMCTIIDGNRSLQRLAGTGMHELAHSWFQHVLGTNEALYAWMDEGFTEYAENWALDQIYETRYLNPHYSAYTKYLSWISSGLEEPASTHSDHFQSNMAYSRGSYTKGNIFLHQLSYVVGQEAFDRGMKRYYSVWKFKHPGPDDFKHEMEQASGLELDWYFEYWAQTAFICDYAIASVKKSPDKTQTILTLERKGEIPMPIDLVITYADGTVEYRYLPLRIMWGEKGADWYTQAPILMEDWTWVNTTYEIVLDKPIKQISSIIIDPTYRMADVDRVNNRWPKDKKKSDRCVLRRRCIGPLGFLRTLLQVGAYNAITVSFWHDCLCQAETDLFTGGQTTSHNSLPINPLQQWHKNRNIKGALD